ncbi:MAG: hypothetical protein ABR521_07095 [Gaiellaceae bacterium]
MGGLRTAGLLVIAGVALAASSASGSGSGTAAGCAAPGTGVASTPAKGELYYTRFSGKPNLNRISFDYDGATLVLGRKEAIGSGVPAADGVIFAPDGDLLVGGGSAVYKVDPKTGRYVTRKMPATAHHLSPDLSDDRVWGAGIPGPLVEIPLDPFADGVRRNISGDDYGVSTVAFDGCRNAYYTSSGSTGHGSFGRIDLERFLTMRLREKVPSAHGMAFDPLTGDLMLFGDGRITQFDPRSQRFVSDLKVEGVTLDQGAADGQGHVFVADNGGNLVFVDYSRTHLIGDKRNVVIKQFLDSSLDDVAPLSGLGSAGPPDPIPGRAVNLDATAGEVGVRIPGTSRFVPLEQASQIPTGSEIDATKGRVRLTSAGPGGKPQSAEFYGGRFVVRQPAGRNRRTELTLTGPLRMCATCPVPGSPGKRGVRERHLWGDGKGVFWTNGIHASAAVRGTRWLTRDTAAGTLVRVQSGTVSVIDRKRKKRFLVKAHRSIFIRR